MNLDKLNELLLNPEQRHVEPRVGQIGHNLMGIDRKSIDQENRTIDFVCSTPDVDRYGEIVLPSAFAKSLKQFMLNPVFPFGHHYEASGNQLPTVGHWKDMRVSDNALIGKAYFKPRGLGEECFQDYIEGNLTSVSVAWLTRSWRMEEREIEGVSKRVRVFDEVDLIEVSAVLIPANPQARLRAASAFAQEANNEPSDDALERRIASILEKQLDASPGGRLCSLIQDIAATLHGHAGYPASRYFGDDLDDDDETPAPSARKQSGDPELKTMLRDAMGQPDAA